MQSFAYFPTNIYRDERPDLVEKVLPICIRHLNRIENSNFLFRQTANFNNEPVVLEIANYILLTSINILREQSYDVNKYDFYISGLWAQEINRGGGTNVHIHKNSQISGWLFLETPQNGSYPIYYDTRMNKSMIELDYIQGQEINNATNAIHFNNMVPGTVMFSNSWMQHQLTVNNSNSPTRCIHFIMSHKEKEHLCNIF